MEETENKLYEKVEVKDLPNSEIEISAEIPVETIEKYRPQAIKHLNDRTDVSGFRKGHIPEKILIEKVGEPAILYEIAEIVLSEIYPLIVLKEKINVIGRPQISITKLAPGNPICFSAKTAVMPRVLLPDYKKTAKDVLKEKPQEDIVITDEEIEKVIKQIKTNKASIQRKNEGKDENEEIKDEDLPELTDEDVKKLGDFRTVKEFEEKLKGNMKLDKERKQKEERRMLISEVLIEKSDISLPNLFVEAELDKIVHELKGHIQATGLTFEDYLKRTDKTEENIREEARGEAEKRAKLQLILNAIANEEEIKPDQDKVEHEVKHIMEHYKDANQEQAHTYVSTLFRNEKVYELLENIE